MSFGDLGGDSDLGDLGGFGGGGRPARYPALPPAEAETALGGLRRRGLGALAYVGSVLDKFGGRAVRGSLDALMGHGGARELASLIPFSDTLGLTKPEDVEKHRGGQLLKHAFHYDPEQARGHWGAWAERNILGPAVELGLDPSTYVGGIGALTKGGQAAAKLGKVPGIFRPGYLGALERGERTLVHGITGRPGVALAHGALGGVEAANQLLRRSPTLATGLDVAGEAGATALEHWRAWTDPVSGWIPHRGIQASHAVVKHPQLAELERGLTEEQGRLRGVEDRLVNPAVPATAIDQDKLRRHWTQALEGVADPRYVDQAFARSLPPEAQAVAGRLRQIGQQVPQTLEAGAGLETHALQDLHDYGMRVRNPIYDRAPAWEPASARQARLLKTTHTAQLERLEGAKGYAGGTEELNDLIAQHGGIKPGDPGWQAVQGGPHVPEFLRGALEGKHGLAPGTPFSINPHDPWVKEAAGFIGSVDKSRLIHPTTGKLEPYFVRDPIQMSLRRGYLAADATTSARTITHALGALAKPVAHFGPDEAKVGVRDVLAKAGMDTPQGLRNTAAALGITPDHVAAHVAATGGLEEARRALQAERGVSLGARPVEEDWATAALKATRGVDLGAKPAVDVETTALRNLLNQHAVDAKTGDELTQLLSRGGPAPYELKGVEKLGRALLGPTKNALYTMWPSSHMRNLNTGKLQALTEAGVMPWSKAYGMGVSALRDPRQAIDFGIKGVKDTAQLLTEAFADRIVGAHAGELAGELPEGLRLNRFATNPLARRPTLREGLDAFQRRVTGGPWVNPIGEQGAGVQLGRAVNTLVEDRLRLGQYIDMRRRGFTRAMARERVFQTHFDYERGMGPAARRFLGNAFLFPTFTYHNVPKQFGLAATHPARISGPLRFAGGGMGQGEEGYVPNYLQGGLNFPLPTAGLPEGTQRYLTSLGTPMEEAFGHVKPGPNPAATLVNQLQDAAGMLRPDIKALIELTTGVQLHTGRQLKELDAGQLQKLAPYLGQDTVTLLAQGIAASPLARLSSTANMLLDPRKATWGGAGLNLGRLTTGMKYSDVDVAKARENDERKMLEAELGGSRNVREGSYFYVPESRRADLSERERQLMSLFATVEKNARVRRAQAANSQYGNP